MSMGDEGGLFKQNDVLLDDAPEKIVVDREEVNKRNAEEMRRKNEAWIKKVKEETESNKKIVDTPARDLNHLKSHHPVSKEESVILKSETGLSKIEQENKKENEPQTKPQKELSEKVKSMRAYEERKAIQEEEMRRDKSKYLENYDKRMKGKTTAGKIISKMAGWLGLWDRNRVGRGKELRQNEGEFYGSLENFASLKDRVAQIESDILSGKRKNAKGEVKEYSQEVIDRYRAKIAKLELSRLSSEQKNVAEKRADTWNQIEEKNAIENANLTWWKNPFRKTLGNRYMRFALMTGTIGALTGGVTSGAWLLGRGIKFGAGIVAGKIGQKGAQLAVDKLLNEEKFIRNKYNRIASDYANGKINALEYDKKIERISLQLNAIKNLLPTIVAGASAAGAGYGLSKLDASTHVFDKISDKVSDTVRSAIPVNYPGLSGVPGQIEVPDNVPTPGIVENPPISNNEPIDWLRPGDSTHPDIEIPLSEDAYKITVPDGAGAIKSVEALQDHLKNIYEAKGVAMPSEISDFVNGDAEKIAINNDWYRPGDANESISVSRGSTIEWDFENNRPVIHNAGDVPQHFFDSGARVSPDSVLENPVNESEVNVATGVDGEKVEINTNTPDEQMANEIGKTPELEKITVSPSIVSVDTDDDSFEVKVGSPLNLDSRTDLPLDYKFTPGENFSAPISSAHFNGVIDFTVGADGIPKIDFEKLGTNFPENFGGNYLTDNPKNLIDSIASSSLNPTDTENLLQKEYNISDEGRLVGNSRLMPYEMYRMLYEELQPAPGTPEYTYLYQRITDLGEKISKDLGPNALKPINW